MQPVSLFIITIATLAFLVDNGVVAGKWESGFPSGLKNSDEQFNKMIFVTDRKGFLFGSNWNKNEVLKLRTEQKSVIYRTEDGGTSWKVALSAGALVFLLMPYLLTIRFMC